MAAPLIKQARDAGEPRDVQRATPAVPGRQQTGRRPLWPLAGNKAKRHLASSAPIMPREAFVVSHSCEAETTTPPSGIGGVAGALSVARHDGAS